MMILFGIHRTEDEIHVLCVPISQIYTIVIKMILYNVKIKYIKYLTTNVRIQSELVRARGSNAATKSHTLIFLQHETINIILL